jgi:hypothetical protein
MNWQQPQTIFNPQTMKKREAAMHWWNWQRTQGGTSQLRVFVNKSSKEIIRDRDPLSLTGSEVEFLYDEYLEANHKNCEVIRPGNVSAIYAATEGHMRIVMYDGASYYTQYIHFDRHGDMAGNFFLSPHY